MIGRSFSWGLPFGGLASLAVAICLTLGWSAPSQPGSLIMMLVMFVPAVTLMGGLAGGFLFGFVGIIVSFSRQRIEASSLSYALIGSVLSLGVIVPFASWIAGGILAALQGRQGVYLLLPTGLLPVAIAGSLVGQKIASEESARTTPPPLEGGPQP